MGQTLAKADNDPNDFSSLSCTGSIGGVDSQILVDTGSVYTLINYDFFKRIEKNQKHSIELGNFEQPLISANGERIEIEGWFEPIIVLGHIISKHKMLVAHDLSHDCLLGMDFLLKNKVTLDLDNLTLKRANKSVPMQVGKMCNSVCRVSLAETTVIPAHHEIVTVGKSRSKTRGISVTAVKGILEPKSRKNANQDILFARELIESTDGKVPVRIVNLSDENVVLYKNTVVGTIQDLSDFSVPDEKTKHSGAAGCSPCVASVTSRAKKILEMIDMENIMVEGEKKEELLQLIREYQDVFSLGSDDLGRTNRITHIINTGDASPIRQSPRRIPMALKDEVKTHIDQMLKSGIIRESQSPWASPIVLVKKKNGGGTRFCIDYRKLNSVTKKDAYPLPRMEDALEALSGSKYFSSLDLISGYWQVEVADKDKEKTAFTTHVGLYEFNVMPFGLSGAPSTFQRLMEAVMSGMQWESCMIYIDDIIIFGKTFSEHNARLRKVFQKLRDAGLKMKPQKCQFLCKEIKYLGHIVSERGIQTDPEKIQAVADWPTPRSADDVKQFIGLASYYRRFITNFAKIAAPLHKLATKGKEFCWSKECEESFCLLKRALVTAPVLSYPCSEGLFVLDTDASDQAIGGVLSQIVNNQEKVICYGSKVLSKAEKNYCTTRQELLAIVYFLKQFRHYLLGRKFKVRTDQKALTWLQKFKDPEGQMARWQLQLAEYDFIIEHRAGRSHSNADALSRKPCQQCGLNPEAPSTASVAPAKVAYGTNDSFMREQQMDPDIAPVLLWKTVSDKRPDINTIAGCSPATKDLWSQ